MIPSGMLTIGVCVIWSIAILAFSGPYGAYDGPPWGAACGFFLIAAINLAGICYEAGLMDKPTHPIIEDDPDDQRDPPPSPSLEKQTPPHIQTEPQSIQFGGE